MKNEPKDILDQAVKALQNAQSETRGPSDELLRRTLEQVEHANRTNPFVERIYKMKPFRKFAAAAIIIVSISAFFLFNTSQSSVALADVYAKVQQAQAFMYKMSMTMSGRMAEGMPAQNVKMESTITISTEYGMKMDSAMHMLDLNQTTHQQMCINPATKTAMMLMPEQKMYMRMEFTDDLLEKTRQQNYDPRGFIKQIMDCKYIDLGVSEINGIKVQGYQTSDPAYTMGMGSDVVASIWVNVETLMPVRTEMSMKMGPDGQMHAVIDDFQWNIQADAAQFEPVIPADYKEMPGFKLPAMDEESAINGLRTYVSYFQEYPKKLDIMTLNSVFAQEQNKNKVQQTEAGQQLKQKMDAAVTDEERVKVIMDAMAPIQSLGMFYMKLMQEKRDPMYYGDRVRPTDTDAVLLRWKLDNGKYKVIFGDLSSVEMEYEDMVKIEPAVEPNAL